MAKPPYPYPVPLLVRCSRCGEGTQGRSSTKIPGFFHLSTGVIFRKLDPKSEEGRIVREYSAWGARSGRPDDQDLPQLARIPAAGGAVQAP